MTDSRAAKLDGATNIAIIGMSGRFPGAGNVDEFWRNVRDGVESITRFSDEELLKAGVDPDTLADPSYVRMGAVLEDIELFDASFFGLTPREAQVMDPQQRLFLEEAWKVVEAAGYDPANYGGAIGVFAGSGLSSYLLNNLAVHPDLVDSVGQIGIVLGNDKDSLTTRAAYLMDLTGPCYTLQTYCSTSLVAVNAACESLLGGTCDMALAGGVLVSVPHRCGYFYQEGSIASPDGRCRAFDANAKGAPLGNGVAVILLKRLEDALADGDNIRAVIRGSAVNNDGALRAGYTAPGVRGQVGVILEALANAEVEAESISYIETHGTGTALGDAIEFQAMTRAFAEHTDRKGFCAIGSVKTNVGHLDRAAGVTGLIKTVLALEDGLIPPSLNYSEPNPDIDFGDTPFYVNTKLRPWTPIDGVRRAGVSSFGIGGTNAHLVVEQAPPLTSSEPARGRQLLLLSAKTPAALEQMTENLRQALLEQPHIPMADVAYTLQVGRQVFEHRRALVCGDHDDAVAGLRDQARLASRKQVTMKRSIAFMFPGVGDHYAGMGLELYQAEPVFRDTLDECCEILRPLLGVDLRDLLYRERDATPDGPGVDLRRMLGREGAGAGRATGELGRTALAQPAVFAVEYALCRLLQSWDIVPDALIGYSLGEYVAACVAGVMSLPDALTLVARRAQLIESLPEGRMLAVPLSAEQVGPYVGAGVDLAVVNSPQTCVLAGPPQPMSELATRLKERDIAVRWLDTSHAFHSATLSAAVEQLTAIVESVRLSPPRIPYLSNVTGEWITDEQATASSYWARHMCQTVWFGDGLSKLLHDRDRILLEVGPGQSLGSFAKQNPDCTSAQWPYILPVMRFAYEGRTDVEFLLGSLGRLWLTGVNIDWQRLYGHERRRRVPLPTYPFERQRHWIDAPHARPHTPPRVPGAAKNPDLAQWFYEPQWTAAELSAQSRQENRVWIVFEDGAGFGRQLAERLRERGDTAVSVRPADGFAAVAPDAFELRPGVLADYAELLQELVAGGRHPTHVAHAWSITQATADNPPDAFDSAQQMGFYSLLNLVRALDGARIVTPLQLAVLCAGAQPLGEQPGNPEQATILGLSRVIPQEYQNIRCRTIDIDPSREADAEPLLEQLLTELVSSSPDVAVAYRNGRRHVQSFVRRPLAEDRSGERLRERGVYLITGGLGAVGLTLARYLAETMQARLVLTGRSALPPREEWAEHLGPDDRVARTIAEIRSIEALGGEVLVLAADAGDEQAMRGVLDRTREEFGPLQGVIHAAGLTGRDAFQPIQKLDRALCESHFRPKAKSLYVLERILQDEPLDFCVLFSSLSSVLGGLGFGAYAAANHFMDAFAQRHNRAAGPAWISVNWDTWNVSGARASGDALGGSLTEFEMTAEEGIAAFSRVLGSDAAQIVNSTGDLESRIRQWVMLEAPAAQAASTLSGGARPELATEFVPPDSQLERRVAEVWQQVLGIEEIGVNDNFFDLGGNSLIGLQLISRMQQEIDLPIPAVALFEAPTVSSLARLLGASAELVEDSEQSALDERRRQCRHQADDRRIAVIGMSGRFPGAVNVEQLWENLCNGRETIATLSDRELLEAGVDPALINDPNYVKRRPIIDGAAMFDAGLFSYSPREAELMDPQHRLFLECSYEALEVAGYSPHKYKGLIGVFGGTNISTYLLHLSTDPELARSVNDYQVVIGNDKDSLTTTVSYKLNLKGPSMAVQTFCSTSLVSTHLACKSLLSGECDIALSGGVSIRVPEKRGHLYQQGGMESPDGHCRTFDARAQGTLFGDAVGVVVLKRLSDALADGDPVHAVIRGSAINNDGSLKVGYTAPSVVGQTEVVAMALNDAGVSAETIGYVEAHGTATELGDPIEVTSLTRAFRRHTDASGYCAIGSVKSNMGHPDRAAGVTGLIKTALAVKHGLIPASLHYSSPNPEIDFEHSPFYVNTELSAWSGKDGTPRRAGINSLGMGGTNAHVVVEQAPQIDPSGPSRAWQLLVYSARSESALDATTANHARHMRQHPDAKLADEAFTLKIGRSDFEHRRMLVCNGREDAIAALEAMDPRRVFTHRQRPVARPLVFMFPGVGDHYLRLAEELYENEPAFRDPFDRCAGLLAPEFGATLAELLYPVSNAGEPEGGQRDHPVDLRTMLGKGGAAVSAAAGRIQETEVAQPLVFAIEYALARLLISWGLKPQAFIGYSLGEYVAACLSGVLCLEDAVKLVAGRARLIQESPRGAMIAVTLGEHEAQRWLSDEIFLAAHNGSRMCVLAGAPDAVDRLELQLHAHEIVARRLLTTHAFHTAMLQSLVDPLTEMVETISLNAPRIPYVSNVTGTWITEREATDPGYWARHMCEPVRFAQGLEVLLSEPDRILLEVGPGQALGSLAKQHPDCGRGQVSQILPTLRHDYEKQSDLAFLLGTLGRLWLLGLEPDWSRFYAQEHRHRVALPPYPFERSRYWLEPKQARAAPAATAEAGGSPEAAIAALPRQEVTDWFYLPGWKQTAPRHPKAPAAPACWLMFADGCGIADPLVEWLRVRDQTVVCVLPADSFERRAAHQYAIRPAHRADYDSLLREMDQQGLAPERIVHLWSVAPATPRAAEDDCVTQTLELGFYSLMALVQAIGERDRVACELTIVSSQVFAVTGTESINPVKAAVLGPSRVVPLEYANLSCRLIDVALPESSQGAPERLSSNLLGELCTGGDAVVALRRYHRWVPTYEPVPLAPPVDDEPARLRAGGVYLITGGLGGIGLAMADYLARTIGARLILVSRSGLPPTETWAQLLAEPGEHSHVSDKIHAVQAIEALGAEVLIEASDVADEEQMRATVRRALARFGGIDGVIHAAGVPGVGLTQFKSPDSAARVLAPKLMGTLVLERALEGIELDWLVLFSSMTSMTGGGPGQIDYCAANAFLDAYAQSRVAGPRLTLSINWGEWQWNAWEDGLSGYDAQVQEFFRDNRRRFGIQFAEGADAFTRLLSSPLPQAVVSTQDFREIVRLSASFTAAAILDRMHPAGSDRPKHARPTLGTSYVMPRNELERRVAAVWSEALGIEEIGIHDNFFELGGNSLIGIDLVVRLRSELEAEDLPAHVLYEAPSVAALAEHLAQDQSKIVMLSKRQQRGERRRERLRQGRRPRREPSP